ncbi:MAG: hypothetical protein M9932_04440 [Xanthobacteraceae bacterium]|nr:hypothetical protein [Xanthobacteraceae bacterium]
MTTVTSSPASSRRRRRAQRRYYGMALLSALLSISAAALIAYLLWPTWRAIPVEPAAPLPISIGGTLFNIPPLAIREKVQRHSGPQERVDLSFEYPSLTPPGTPRHVNAETVTDAREAIRRIFLSIAEHHGAMSPQTRLQTIYPRYLEPTHSTVAEGLTLQAFRDGTPYEQEDLLLARDGDRQLVARCTRDSDTPGTCLVERRVNGADLTFRFPRQWLARWRDVAAAMDGLTDRLRSAHE